MERMRIDLDGVPLHDGNGRVTCLFRYRTVEGLVLRLPESVDVTIPWEHVREASLDLARKLGLSTVAEGVESIEDWQMLAELGCTIAQGYLIGRPVPGSELQAAINRWRRPVH